MINQKKGSIEQLAKFFIDEHHKEYDFDFDRDIKRIEFSNCFLLRIFSQTNQLKRLYLICPIDRLVAETSQPFYEKMLKFYGNEETIPHKNYWFGYIEVDDNFMPRGSQKFEIPEKFRIDG